MSNKTLLKDLFYQALQRVIFVVMCLVMNACSAPVENQYFSDRANMGAIIGGQDLGQTHQKSIKFSVAAILLINSAENLEICTGVFIQKNIILTAAHCVSENINDIKIKMGDSVFEENRTLDLNPIKVVRHPNYETNGNDLALIQIENVNNLNISPVKIAMEPEMQLENNFLVIGYGVNQVSETDDGLQGAGLLRQVEFSKYLIHNNQFTYSVNQSFGYGVCYGDSGSPAFIASNGNYAIAAIASGVSQANDQEACLNQSVFTKVSAYKNWISESVQILNQQDL